MTYNLVANRKLLAVALTILIVLPACTNIPAGDNGDDANTNADIGGNENSNANENENANDSDDNQNNNGAVNAAALTVGAGEHILGSASATVTVIEYIDFQCSVCRAFALNAFPGVEEAYIDRGDVRWVFRNFPLTAIHEFAVNAAVAAECAADQGLFLEYHDVLFENQPDFENAQLTDYAEEVGLDLDVFTACVESGDKLAGVEADIASGLSLGVGGTPTFFVNGQGFFGGLTLDRISDILDAALVEAEDDATFGGGAFRSIPSR